jgi:hypothetical protein
MANPAEILALVLQRAIDQLDQPVISDAEIVARVEAICRNITNRACVRFVLACSLAKAHRPHVDIRKPYTEIREPDAYSGRTYDEQYITAFIIEHNLPCNTTTAFLTPAFRNRNTVLTPDILMVGRPESLYRATLQLLTDVQAGRTSAEDLLAETVRRLLAIRTENLQRMETLLAGLQTVESASSLSAEAIVGLIERHMSIRRASRLPVLIVAAAYQAASRHLGEQALPLQSHNAADRQTDALGDVEITLVGEDKVITSYEMKTRRVTQNDIDQALRKIENTGKRVDQYVFITTDKIDEEVTDYAASLYERTGGIEVVVLDCISFLRHFLHLFHRLRREFLDAYQQRVLAEANSSVSQPLKEAFLALRQAAESNRDVE